MNAFIQQLFHSGLYKRSQGRITRQVTFFAIAIILFAGLVQLNQALIGFGPGISYGVPGVLLLMGLWAAYRLVNVPTFADFLIAVEAEMNKVSWPSRSELIRSSLVVLITIFSLAFVLFGFDALWSWVFRDIIKIL